MVLTGNGFGGDEHESFEGLRNDFDDGAIRTANPGVNLIVVVAIVTGFSSRQYNIVRIKEKVGSVGYGRRRLSCVDIYICTYIYVCVDMDQVKIILQMALLMCVYIQLFFGTLLCMCGHGTFTSAFKFIWYLI